LVLILAGCDALESEGPIVGALMGADAELTLVGPAGFGRAVIGGDFNGDGVGDLVVLDDAGVRVFSGPLESGLSIDDADAVIRFGSGAVLAVGDLDGDGTDDLVVGVASAESDGIISGGIVMVFSGPLAGSLAASDARSTFPGTHGYERLGGHVSVGDFDGDGVADLAVTAAGLPRDECFGAVLVFLGPLAEGRTGVPGADASIDCAFAMDAFPDTGGFIGDLDGDGAEELAATAQGNVYVARGGFSGPLSAGDTGILLRDREQRGRFGSVFAVGDVDRDGLSDVLVATLDDDGLGRASGAIDVITRPLEGTMNLPDAAATTFVGGPEGTRAGWAVDAGGDLDGDGFVDVVFTSPGPESSSDVPGDGGHAWLFYGPLEDADFDDAAATIDGESGAELGTSVRIVRDLNNDSYPELVVGAPGSRAVHIFLGDAR
jgi:hypothetical protein